MKAKKKKKKLPKRRKPIFAQPGVSAKPRTPADDPNWHPLVADGEPLIDAAVVSSKVRREQLDESLRPAAQAIADALRRVAEGKDAAAIETLADIPRSSPFASWKLFVRGLIAHYQGDTAAAEANWSRLEPGRRPARIAAVLRAARGDNTAAEGAAGEAADPAAVERLRRFRQVRPAAVEAKRIAAAAERPPSRDRERRFGAADVAALVTFRVHFGKVEPELVAAFSDACVLQCVNQPHSDVFDMIAARVPGPLHDPKWNLLASAYYNRFADVGDRASKLADRYLEHDLPQVPLPPQFRDALASVVWNGRAIGRWQRVRRGTMSPAQVTDACAAAIRAVPTNAAAHRTLVDFWTWAAKDADTAAIRKQYETKAVAARQAWVEAIPDEFDQRIILIDHYLDSDKIDVARELASTITDRRSDNPLVTALPWKLELRHAMQLSKLKRNLPAAAESLDRAAKMWPKWLPDDWLPFLRAGLALRGGDESTAERLLEDVRKSDRFEPVAFDVLRFGAAQQMNVPAAAVRPLRAAVERHVESLERLETPVLIDLGAAFWQLHRVGLLYRGYRNHGSKFGRELAYRLETLRAVAEVQKLSDAGFWAAANGFWQVLDPYDMPLILSDKDLQPRYAPAILLSGLIADRYVQGGLAEKLVEEVRELAGKETDPFYRYLFGSLVKQADEQLGERKRGFSRFGDDDFDDDDYDDGDDYDDDDWEDSSFEPDLSSIDRGMLDVVWKKFVDTAPPPLQPLFRGLPDEGRVECLQAMFECMESGSDFEVASFLDVFSRYYPPQRIIAAIEQLEFADVSTGTLDTHQRKKARRR